MDLYYILEAICNQISSEFINTNIYVNQVPQSFKRPSFYVELVGFNDSDLSMGALNRKAIYHITHFNEVNDRNLVNKTTQHTALYNLNKIFSNHRLQVEDRYIKINSKDGYISESDTHLTLNLEYSIDNALADINSGEELIEFMNNIQIKYIYN